MAETAICLIDVVGLTPAHIGRHTPALKRLADSYGGAIPLGGVEPAVTCPAQASMLTGALPSQHGIVGNGWLYRDTMEIRLWQQSNRLLQAEPVYETARLRAQEAGVPFSCAQLFWWFNQGAAVDWSLTPKPHYGSDGSKEFGVHGWPDEYPVAVEKELGPFPFSSFWGPMAGLPSSEWIARAAAHCLQEHRPSLTLVYLPHLDYDLQRYGPAGEHLADRVAEVDRCVGTIVTAANQAGADVWVVSEYGLLPVTNPVFVNQKLRADGMLVVRDGPFGEMLDTFESQAFAMCDHQIAHVYVKDPANIEPVAQRLSDLDGVENVLVGEGIAAHGLDHPRSGEVVLLSARDAWFAYPYWLDDRRAPDFAHSVDIHRKPGYDPCELFFDPRLPVPKARAAWRLLQKKLGFRYRMDVVGLDTSLVRGSHGRPALSPENGPLFIGSGARAESIPMTALRDRILEGLDLA